MSIQIVLTTTAELFASAIHTSRELSEKILQLADLNASPLAPGETPDTRRHQIAKFAKLLAEAFLTFDALVRDYADNMTERNDVTASPVKPTPDNPNSN